MKTLTLYSVDDSWEYFDNHNREVLEKSWLNKQNALRTIQEMVKNDKEYSWLGYSRFTHPRIYNGEFVRYRPILDTLDIEIVDSWVEVTCKVEYQSLKNVETIITKTIDGKDYSRKETIEEVVQDWKTLQEERYFTGLQDVVAKCCFYLKQSIFYIEDAEGCKDIWMIQ